MPDVRDNYRALVEFLRPPFSDHGFKLVARQEFVRTKLDVLQRLALSLRESSAEKIGYVEAFAGFNFSRIELAAAKLQGKQPRKGFLTCSLNLGLITERGVREEWPLRKEKDAELIGSKIIEMTERYATPFWEEFSSVQRLLSHFEERDRRVCGGIEWRWRQVAANLQLARPKQALDLLHQMLSSGLGYDRQVVEKAIGEVSKNFEV